MMLVASDTDRNKWETHLQRRASMFVSLSIRSLSPILGVPSRLTR